ncbi:MAG: hypothetical protein AAGD14_04080 [Planctomycetota bacterium]
MVDRHLCAEVLWRLAQPVDAFEIKLARKRFVGRRFFTPTEVHAPCKLRFHLSTERKGALVTLADARHGDDATRIDCPDGCHGTIRDLSDPGCKRRNREFLDDKESRPLHQTAQRAIFLRMRRNVQNVTDTACFECLRHLTRALQLEKPEAIGRVGVARTALLVHENGQAELARDDARDVERRVLVRAHLVLHAVEHELSRKFSLRVQRTHAFTKRSVQAAFHDLGFRAYDRNG